MNGNTQNLVANMHDDILHRTDLVFAARPWLVADPEVGNLIADVGKTGGVCFTYDALQQVELLADRVKKAASVARTERERNDLNSQAAGILEAADLVERILWQASRA